MFSKIQLIRSDTVVLAAYKYIEQSSTVVSSYNKNRNLMTRLLKRLEKIKNKIEDNLKKWNSKRIVIYGAGGGTTLFLANNSKLCKKVEIAFDQDIRKHNRYIPGTNILVHPPDKINNSKIDMLLFTSSKLHKIVSPHIKKICYNLEQLWEE